MISDLPPMVRAYLERERPEFLRDLEQHPPEVRTRLLAQFVEAFEKGQRQERARCLAIESQARAERWRPIDTYRAKHLEDPPPGSHLWSDAEPCQGDAN